MKAHLSERRDAGDAKFAESLELMAFLTSLLGSEHIERFVPLATGNRSLRAWPTCSRARCTRSAAVFRSRLRASTSSTSPTANMNIAAVMEARGLNPGALPPTMSRVTRAHYEQLKSEARRLLEQHGVAKVV